MHNVSFTVKQIARRRMKRRAPSSRVKNVEAPQICCRFQCLSQLHPGEHQNHQVQPRGHHSSEAVLALVINSSIDSFSVSAFKVIDLGATKKTDGASSAPLITEAKKPNAIYL